MKFIAKSNLISILDAIRTSYISEETLVNIIKWYGESYLKEPGDNDWTKMFENEQLKKFLGDKYEELPKVIRHVLPDM